MKVFKTIFWVMALLGLLQCKKDDKKPLELLMPNGKYGFRITDQFGSDINFNYTILNNYFYVEYYDTVCLNRAAGKLYKNDKGEIQISKLHKGNNSIDPCSFSNDEYGGDTMLIIFDSIVPFMNKDRTEAISRMALKGHCSYLLRSGIIYPKIYGPFVLAYSNVQ